MSTLVDKLQKFIAAESHNSATRLAQLLAKEYGASTDPVLEENHALHKRIRDLEEANMASSAKIIEWKDRSDDAEKALAVFLRSFQSTSGRIDTAAPVLAELQKRLDDSEEWCINLKRELDHCRETLVRRADQVCLLARQLEDYERAMQELDLTKKDKVKLMDECANRAADAKEWRTACDVIRKGRDKACETLNKTLANLKKVIYEDSREA